MTTLTSCMRPPSFSLGLPVSSVSSGKENGASSSSSSYAHTANLPRLSLRKRKVNTEHLDHGANLNLTSVNSAFLTGLFADVAEVDPTPSVSVTTSSTTHCPPTKSPSMAALPVDVLAAASACTSEAAIRPGKKSRLSMSRSISRCAKSFKSLGDAAAACLELQQSPTCATDVVRIQAGAPTLDLSSNSTSGSVSPDPFSMGAPLCDDVDDVEPSLLQGASLVFPHLPTAVSMSSSCNTLTRNSSSDLQSSLAEAQQKEAQKLDSAYGWFVVTDEEDQDQDSNASTHPLAASVDPANPYAKGSSDDLAFLAPTAPLASKHHDEEVEWAKAADTVDDVLGDFF